MSTVGKSEHMKAVSERASKLSEGVSGLYTSADRTLTM